MFKKKTNFRKKAVVEEDDVAGDAHFSGEPPGSAGGKGGTLGNRKTGGKSSSKNGGSAKASAALLSFEDEEADAGVFQVMKKTIAKKKSMRAPDALFTRAKGGGNEGEMKPSIRGGDYTPETLRELAKSQKNFDARPAEHTDPHVPAQIKLRGTLKPSETKAFHIPQEHRQDGDDFLPPPPPRRKDHVASGAGRMTPKSEAETVQEIAILDTAAIAAAKAKREQMRAAASSAPDFIPVPGSDNVVDVASRGGRGAGPGDLEDDDSEHNVRVKFGIGECGGSRGGEGVFSSVAMEIEDGEDESWEEEQLRKVMGVGSSAAVAKAAKSKVVADAASTLRRNGVGVGARRAQMASSGIVAGGDHAIDSLRAGLARAEASRHAVLNDLKRADDSLTSSEAALEVHTERLSVAGERYRYVQELRDYFRDLCECMRVKTPIIEELEGHIQRLHEQRGITAAELAEADRNDQVAEAEAAVGAAQAALMRGVSRAEAIKAATEAAEKTSAARLSGDSGIMELDEFGRDVNLATRRAAEQRAVARHALHTKEEAAVTRAHCDSDDVLVLPGEADDAEDPREVQVFYKEWKQVRDAGVHVLRDASLDFSSISSVKAKAEEWKKKFPKTYRDAYMSASTPQLFAPFVRLELLSWSPLYALEPDAVPNKPAAPIDSMSWYLDLFDYGMPTQEDEMSSTDDADANLVPALIEKLLVPVVDHAVRVCWEPSSVEQSQRLSAVMKEMLIYLEPVECSAMSDLLTSVKKKLMNMSETSCVIPAWAPVVTAAAPVAAMYVRRQLGVALRCVRAAVSWEGVLPSGELKAVVYDAIISQHIAPHLRLLLAYPGQCLLGIERTLDAMSTVGIKWLVQGSSHGNISHVRSVAATLGQLVRSHPEVHGAEAARNDTTGKVVDPRRLVRVLMSLEEQHEAQSVSKLFGI